MAAFEVSAEGRLDFCVESEMKAIYFDIGDTLGSVEISASKRLLRVFPFASVFAVLQQLRERDIALGILSNTGLDRAADVDRVLGDANILHYFHSDLRIYSADVGITKRRIEMFELARGRAGRVLGGCPDVYFVGENRSERGLAKLAGLGPVPHPSLVEAVLDGEGITYVRASCAAGHLDDSYLHRLGLIPLGTEPGSPHCTVCVTTERAGHAARAAGIRLEPLFPSSSPALSDLYLVRGDARDGGTSSASEKLVPVGAGETFSDRRRHPQHGHLQYLYARDERALPFTEPTTIEARLSRIERNVLAKAVAEDSLGDAISRIIGEEDGIGRNRHVLSPEMDKVVERLAADLEEAGNGLIRVVLQPFELSAGCIKPVHGQPIAETVPLWNVIGELKGHTDELVLVTAHLDSTSRRSCPGTYDPRHHEAPGADDDASGVAAVMRIANAFSILFADRKPQRTVRFVLFNAEEQGLHGSARYARLLADQKAAVVAVFQMDMIGYNGPAPNTFESHAGTAKCGSPEDPKFEASAVALAGLVRDMSIHLADHCLSILVPAQVYQSPDCAAGQSDHASFLSVGIPACVTSEDFFGESCRPADRNPNYHRAEDVVVDLPYATSIARVVGAAALRTAEPTIDESVDHGFAAAEPKEELQADPKGRCVLFSGGNRFCAVTVANLTEARVKRIAAKLPKGGKGLSDQDRRVAERLLGPLDMAERTLSFSEPLNRLLAVVRAIPNIDRERLEAQVLDTLTSRFDSGFAEHVYLTPSFEVHYQTSGSAQVDLKAGDVEVREPGTDTLLATLPDSAIPSYVRRLGFWLERALDIYTSPPFSLANPAKDTRLHAFIIDTEFGGASANGFFVGNNLPDSMLVAVTVHELFHMIQYMYDGSGRWHGALFEGGATYAEDAVADSMNRYLYEAESGFRGTGILENPNQALDDSASRYKTALFWRYLTERRSAPGVPGAGADAYRRVLEECSRSGFTLCSVERAIGLVSWGADFFRFTYDDADGHFLTNNETVWGNFAVALIARELDRQTTDRRFRFDEDGERIFFDDALRKVPGYQHVPSRDRMTKVSRTPMQVDGLPGRVNASVSRFASLYHEIDLEDAPDQIAVTVDSATPAFRPLVQMVVVTGDALVDVYRHQSSNIRRVLTMKRENERIDRLFVVVSGTTMGGDYEMRVCGADREAALMITDWNCRPGLHYSIDPAHGAWTYTSPDLWFAPVDNKRNEVFVRIRNQGTITSPSFSCTLDYLPGEPPQASADWTPLLKPDGSPLVLGHKGIAAGGVETLSGIWLPTARSSLGLYTLRARLKEQGNGALHATAMSRLGHETQYDRSRRSTRLGQPPWPPTARDTDRSRAQRLVPGSRMSDEETQASVDTLPETLQSLGPRCVSVELAAGGNTQVAFFEWDEKRPRGS